MSSPGNFQQALTLAYRENPCQVLPNALWKSIPWEAQFETHFEVEAGQVTQLAAFGPKQLMLYWNRNRSLPHLLIDHPGPFEFALLHRDFETALNLEGYPDRYLSFRLIHRMEAFPTASLSPGFSFAQVDGSTGVQKVADLINRCYVGTSLSPETVKGWQQHPVFDPQLWVWIMDEAQNAPAALGIAEFDPAINEGSLEWIQVLPAYRRLGLGQQIVCELLRRLEGRAAFTTVAGRMDNRTHPERLYRRCGFEGDDLWWVLRRQGK
jgi:ribosomal protein S18 acetylase RimI-like enzyme